jgi:AAA domain, putative AbiEii toxin, Type IV TA system
VGAESLTSIGTRRRDGRGRGAPGSRARILRKGPAGLDGRPAPGESADVLQGFDIKGFRTFKHLRIDRLARVNLVVGRNNVGKTMLLEALRLYVDGAHFASIARLLLTRNEVAALAAPRRGAEAELRLEALFHGRPAQLRADDAICLQDPTAPASALYIEAVERQGKNKKPRQGLGRILRVRRGQQSGLLDASELSELGMNSRHPGWPLEAPAFVHAGRMAAPHMGWLWDRVALTARAANVVNALRVIAPVEGIALVADPASYREGERVAMARVTSETEPVPLASLGDGMLRVFELALATEFAASPTTSRSTMLTTDAKEAGGDIIIAIDEPVLLIDEVEIGVHYSALPDVWRYLFRAARERGIQVFATTHSWDCIEAFQQAAAEEPEGSAVLMRLEQKGQDHRAVLFDQDELPTVTKHHIEVR